MTLGFLKGKLSIRIRCRGKFRVRYRGMTSFCFWNKYRRDGWSVADSDKNSFKFEFASSRWVEYRRGFELVSLFFGNHFVVELLWPLSREENADDSYGGV